MKIHVRMIIGFACILGLAAVIGVMGLTQINAVSANLDEITQIHMEAADDVMEIEICAVGNRNKIVLSS